MDPSTVQGPKVRKNRNGGSVCCVPGCKSTTQRTKNVSWHRLPKNPELLRLWLKKISRCGKTSYTLWQPKSFHRICGLHFNKSGRRSGEDIPRYNLPVKGRVFHGKDELTIVEFASIQTGVENVIDNKSCSTKEVAKHVDISRALEDKKHYGNTEAPTSVYPEETPHVEVANSNVQLNEECMENECIHLRQLMLAQQELEVLRAEIAQLKMENGDIDRERKVLRNTVVSLKLKNSHLAKQGSRECANGCRDVNEIVSNESKLKFYTGFQSTELYTNFTAMIRPHYDAARQCLKEKNYKRQNVKCLSFEQQLLMVLMYLRLGLMQQDLAYRIHIDVGTVSRILTFWLPFLANLFEKLHLWPSVDVVQKYMPNSFKELYPQTRCIIDCTEIFIQKATDYNVQSETYSSYKSHNTAKGLVAIAPNGYVSFVSNLYGGRTSDKEITRKSGLVKLLERGDSVMADRGFLISDLLAEHDIEMNIPPFLEGREQFSPEDDETTKKIASLRVHVERIIGQIKCFRILQYIFPVASHTSLNSTWKVCSYLCNFTGLPLLDRKTNKTE